MKAFFGALILSMVSAVVGVFASSELHEMAAAAGGASAVIRATPDHSTQQQDLQIVQQVNYSVAGAARSGGAVSDTK
jgi:hypothetical protein